MSEETTGSTAKLNLGNFADKELEALVPMIEKELAKRRETRKKDALEKMRAIAEDVGMTPEELLGLDRPRRGRLEAHAGERHRRRRHVGRGRHWLPAVRPARRPSRTGSS